MIILENIKIKMYTDEAMAIDILEFIQRKYEEYSDQEGTKKYVEALQMGIDALKEKKISIDK